MSVRGWVGSPKRTCWITGLKSFSNISLKMASYGRRRSFTIGTLDAFASSIPPSSPVRRPADPVQFPPRLMLPPTYRKGEQVAGSASNCRYAEMRGKEPSTFKETGEFDPKLSSSAPTQNSVLAARLLADLTSGSERTSDPSKLMFMEGDNDFELNEIDHYDIAYGSIKSASIASDPQTDFESMESNSSKSDEIFVKDTKNDLAKDFVYHFSFNGEVARPIDLPKAEVRNISSSISAAEMEAKMQGLKVTSNLSGIIEKSQPHQGKQIPGIGDDRIETFYAPRRDFPNRYKSDQVTTKFFKDELPKSGTDKNLTELRWENTARPQTFSTSPILGFALEKARANFSSAGGMEEPPEFTLDFSYAET